VKQRNYAQSVALAAGLVLAACGGTAAPTSQPASSPAAPASAKPSQAPGSAAASSAPAAAISSGAAASAKPSQVPGSGAPASSAPASAAASGSTAGPIKIGIAETLTGPVAENGKDNQDGFNLFLDSINSTVAGRQIQPLFIDDQGKADVGLTKTTQLVESDKVQVLMGLLQTPVCYAVAQYAKQMQIPTIISGQCGAEYLFNDPKYASPYLIRVTQNASMLVDPAADWSYKQGFRKAILLTDDYGGGLEAGDAFASAFINRGGSVIQELHPALGTNDFGPIVAQFDPSADVVATMLIGTDGVRFGEAFASYSGAKKPKVVEFSGITFGTHLAQLKDKAVGMIGEANYTEAIDTPTNQAFLKAFHAKYPGRPLSADVAHGYAGAQVLVDALKRVNGNIEQKQQFLDALYASNVDTAKGPIKLEADHDVIANDYVYEVTKQGDAYPPKLLETYQGVSKLWDRTPQELAKLMLGTNKGKWVGMTKDQLDKIING